MKILSSLIALTVLTLHSVSAVAHGEDDHGAGALAESASVSGPIELSDAAIINLGIKTVVADVIPVRETIKMVSSIELLPEKHAKITPRFQGKVTEILVKLGEKIKKGQALAKLDPINIGNKSVTLRAPRGGYLIQQHVVLGETVDVGDVLMEVADYSKVLAEGIMYESPNLSKIKTGYDASFVADIFPSERFTGKIQRMDIALEDRTFHVYALLENKKLRLIPRLQGSLEVYLGKAEELLMIPNSAILGDTGNYFVFVKEGNLFERRDIVLGIRQGRQQEIIEGVFPGEEVVIRGNYQLQYATPKKTPVGSHTDHGHSHD